MHGSEVKPEKQDDDRCTFLRHVTINKAYLYRSLCTDSVGDEKEKSWEKVAKIVAVKSKSL